MNKSVVINLLLLLLLSACLKSKDTVELTDTNLKEEMPLRGNIYFTFNQDVVEGENLYQWVSTPYVKFEPPIDGAFKWTTANKLIFSPVNPLPPATKFEAVIDKDLLVHSKKNKIKSTTVEFSTPLLKIEDISAFWTVNEENGEPMALLKLFFNFPVDEDLVFEKLSLTVDNKKVDFVNNEFSKTHILALHLNKLEFTDIDYELELKISKGLKPIDGNVTTSNNFEKSIVIKSPYKLKIQDVASTHNGVSGEIDVNTSQEVDMGKLNEFIKISPNVKFKTEAKQGGFKIISDNFDASAKYTLTLKEGLKGVLGGKLTDEVEEQVIFGKIQPSISFENSKGFYLSGKGNKNIQARIIGVEKVKVTISKLYENNILAAGNYGSYNNYYYRDYNYYEDESFDHFYRNVKLEDVILEKEYATSELTKSNGTHLLNLNFEDELQAFDGVYHISIQSTDDYWLKDNRLISISDIGLMAKIGKNNMIVFANSIKTAQPLSNVSFKLFGINNQLIGEGTTNSNGWATIQLKNKNLPGFKPALLTAKSNNDFNILNLRDTKVNTSRFDVGGYAALPNGLQTFTYSERDIYRPGENVNAVAIIRNQKWESPGKLPVKVEVTLPNGKQFKSFNKQLNEEGSIEVNFTLNENQITGAHTIQFFSSNNVLLGSKTILVEEFMPDRIKVKATLKSEKINLSEKNQLEIEANNLFGTPAANRNYEVEVSLKKKYFSPQKYKDFTFQMVNTSSYFDKTFISGTTDKDGKASESIAFDESLENMGMLHADVYTTVFDETGRPVNAKNTFDISTQDTYFGIGNFGNYLSTNQSINIPLVALNSNGNLANDAKAIVQIVKHEYKTVLKKYGSSFRYESNQIEKVIAIKNITLSKVEQFKFTPLLSGRYEVRIYHPKTNNRFVSRSFYAYGYGNTNLASFDVDTEGNIEIELDKETYNPRENAKVLFKTPFPGKILVTLEAKDVLEYFYVNTDERSAELVIPLKESYLPNVYISATLFKPHSESEIPFTVAHGYQSINIQDEQRKLDIAIDAVEKSRSKTKQTIKIKTVANAKVSVAVVDEGILQITNFKTPAPYDYFYQKRALQVSGHNIYPFLFPELSAAKSTGGDGGFDMAMRTNPLQNNRVKPVAFWSGILSANNRGEAEFEVDIPQFSGSLRIMAVSHKGNGFGNTEKDMIVADPIVLSSGIPRFLSPGDTAIVSTNLSNTTNKLAKVKASIKVDGNLSVVGSAAQNVEVNAGSENSVSFKVYAQQAIGVGSILVEANALGEKFIEKTDLTIRPASPLVKLTGSGVVEGGKKATANLPKDDFMEESASYTLMVSKNPMVEFAEDLDYLIRYPYGCTEQTISAVFPQLYFGDIARMILQNDKDLSADITNNIQRAITVLKMRQTYNGGFTMWDSGRESWWVTAYALHFMVEAKKAGYKIDDNLMHGSYSYLSYKLKTKETTTYYYQNNKTRKIAPHEVAYSLYAMALYNRPDASLMNYYKNNDELLTSDSKYMLLAAFAVAGDKQRAIQMLPDKFVSENSQKASGGSFYSPVRDEAIALNALLEVDFNHPQVPVMAKSVAENLKGKKYLSTQERIYTLLALGKIARKASQSTVEADILLDGKKVASYQSGVLNLDGNVLKSGKVEIDTKGNGNLYYFWQAKGISKSGKVEEVDNYLKVRRTLYDRYGNVLMGNKFKQNDLIVVKLSVDKSYNTTIENVVLSDMLPAGFEIENPRVTEIPGTDWIKNQSYPTHLDVRDDRINLFVDLHGNAGSPKNYYYVVRAVTPGIYIQGPASADAMYIGEYHSYNGAGVVVVE